MASEALVQRALTTFDKLDAFGKRITAHAMHARTKEELECAFRGQDDFTLEMSIEEMEFELKDGLAEPAANAGANRQP